MACIRDGIHHLAWLSKQAGPKATRKTWEKLDISGPVRQIEAAEKKLKAFVLLIANRQP
jgi:hypothetical protein